MAIDPENIPFTDGMKYVGKDLDSMTPSEKVALYKSTAIQEPVLDDLKLISPFKVHRYYED